MLPNVFDVMLQVLARPTVAECLGHTDRAPWRSQCLDPIETGVEAKRLQRCISIFSCLLVSCITTILRSSSWLVGSAGHQILLH